MSNNPTLTIRRGVRVPGVAEAASRLGCTAGHLWRVAIGERTSPRLLAAYHAFCQEHGLTAPALRKRKTSR